MIRCIVAIDSKRGMANNEGIPWELPKDIQYFREKTENGSVLMGYATYKEFKKPLHNRINYVANLEEVHLRPGFTLVRDAKEFVQNFRGDLWIIGGAGLFAQTIQFADELFLTRLEGDFKCTKFFPDFEEVFTCVERGKQQDQNGISFRFEVWARQ